MTMGDTFTVTAPTRGFNGDLAGLVFRDGRATADSDTDARALAYCRRHSYTIKPASQQQGDDEPAAPKPNASKAEWVAYAVAQGADPEQADAMTKTNLVDQYGTKGPSDD